MFHIISSVVFFLVAVMVHILWCRAFPKKDLRMLVFCVIAGIFLIALAIFQYFFLRQGDAGSLWMIPLPLTALILYLLLVPTYLNFYFLTKVESPTKRLLLFLQKKEKATYEELSAHMPDQLIIDPRLVDLVHCGFAVMQGEGYRLLPRGHRTAVILKTYEKMVQKEMGG